MNVFSKGTVLQHAISADSFEAVKFLSVEKLGEEDIVKVWKSALATPTSIHITRYLHNIYPFDETKHIKGIENCVVDARWSVLEFLVERRVNFGEILKKDLIAKVSDGWDDGYVKKFYERAFDEYHPELLDHFERKLGEAAFFKKKIRQISQVPSKLQLRQSRKNKPIHKVPPFQRLFLYSELPESGFALGMHQWGN
jgi:hypothetical protein